MTPPLIKQPAGYVRGTTPLNDPAQLALHVRKELEKVQRFQPNTRTVTVTANYSVAAQDRTILVDTTAADVTITLPKAAQLLVLPLAIVKISTDAHVVHVVPAVGDTVAGGASLAWSSKGGSQSFVPDGVHAWRVDGVGGAFPNDATKYLDGTGAFSVPAGGGGGGSGAPALGAFPVIADLKLRISAELSARTLNTGNRVAQVNDLSGSGLHMTAAAAARPYWHGSLFNRMRPALVFDGATAGTFLSTSGTFVLPQPCSVVVVAEGWSLGTAGGNGQLWMNASGNPEVFLDGSQTMWEWFAGGTILTSTALLQQVKQAAPFAPPTTPFVQITVWNGAASLISANGVEVTGSPGANGFTTQVLLGGKTGPVTSGAKMYVYEMLIYGHALTAAERLALNTYYMNALSLHL